MVTESNLVLPEGYEAGDPEAFFRYCHAMQAWYDQEVQAAYDNARLPSGNWDLCFGCLVYGRRYVERFLQYGLPSLLAPGNIPALAGGGSLWLLFHTDREGADTLEASPGVAALKALGARVDYRIIPEEIISLVPKEPANKYWLLGGAHMIQMQEAKYQGHGYHMLMPDHVYSENYFRNLKRLALSGKDVIVQGSPSATAEDTAGELENDGVLAVSCERLCAAAITHLHEQHRPYVMNGRDFSDGSEDYPVHTFMIFVGEKQAVVACPHMSPVYFAHRILMKMPCRIFNTIDGQLPFLVSPTAEPYMPTAGDDMNYIEISSRDKVYNPSPRVCLTTFCVRFWMMCFGEDGFLPYLDLDTVLPLPEGFAHPWQKMSDPEAMKVLNAIRRAIRDSRDRVLAALPARYRKDPLPQRAA